MRRRLPINGARRRRRRNRCPAIAPTTYSGVVQVADAIEWITAQEKAQPGKPWFSWVAFNLAHATSQQQPSAMMVPNADTLDAATLREMKACDGAFGTRHHGHLQRRSAAARDVEFHGHADRQAADGSGRASIATPS